MSNRFIKSVELDEEEINRLADDLQINDFQIVFSDYPNPNLFGFVRGKNRLVQINLSAGRYGSGSIAGMVRFELERTILHEMRHLHQRDHWPADLSRNDAEADARRFENENVSKYRLVKRIVYAHHGQSPLSKLQRAEDSARKGATV